jgi:hypothetical protein
MGDEISKLGRLDAERFTAAEFMYTLYRSLFTIVKISGMYALGDLHEDVEPV